MIIARNTTAFKSGGMVTVPQVQYIDNLEKNGTDNVQ